MKHFLFCVCESEPLWVLAIPLYHFLREDVKPGGSVKLNLKHTTAPWWGTTGLNDHINKFRDKDILTDR